MEKCKHCNEDRIRDCGWCCNCGEAFDTEAGQFLKVTIYVELGLSEKPADRNLQDMISKLLPCPVNTSKTNIKNWIVKQPEKVDRIPM